MSNWEHSDKSYLYYDFMSRDFFKYLSGQSKTQNLWKTMGSGRFISRTGSFENKALTAYNLAVEAISKEDYPFTAKTKWREIYGNKFPL